jgi:hypothetical protein
MRWVDVRPPENLTPGRKNVSIRDMIGAMSVRDDVAVPEQLDS